MKNKIITIVGALMAGLIMAAGCTMDGDITTEIKGYTGDDPMQICIMGYICNEGVLVEIQKAQAPFGTDSQIVTIPEVKAEIFRTGTDMAQTTLESQNGTLFYSPTNFKPISNVEYYIKVTAPGYHEVTSTPQPLQKPFEIDSVHVEKSRINLYYLDPDTILEDLFGIRNYYRINTFYKIPDSLSRDGGLSHIIYSKGVKYRDNGYYGIKEIDQHSDLIGIGSLFHFDYDYFSNEDHIKIAEKYFDYNGTTYQVRHRIDSVKFMAFSFDVAVETFMLEQYNYHYSNEPYFSITTKTPSNLSNGIGLFTNGWCTTKTIIFDQFPSDSLAIYQP